MSLRGSFLIIALFAISGCSAWAPTMVSTGARGIYYSRSGKGEELHRASMKKAYMSAIRTMNELGLQIIEIKEGDQRRTITAHDPNSRHRVSVELQGMGEGKYIKAGFKAVNHGLVPDRLYTRMIMEEFRKNLGERTEGHQIQRGKEAER
ncbi:MAG TPA: hypothetical protein EYP17_04090 [Candidatus Latescibacteria bacterium]|nr:hypothetical protein [Candidatus Latescibacterota bacterium]